ncbi:hypothetical protein F5J12DRAFT_825417 [Pisolithus orientalis]|uniref:uncharacterized protein n=1 Tax=Pisolithus orientalis TaxID=936130 RepID=UPI002223F2B7|nr:uncharacterized protein F5J12DRAFT_825417 [Pisolithus orientalis]KAI6008758.1 hypothetical protein F5J12DRAFT_825417 [Pisolithus orientalis]
MRFTAMLLALFACFFFSFLFFSNPLRHSRSNRHYRGFTLFKPDALPSCKTAFTWHHNTQKGKERKDRGGF